jgi:hypothetical protein
MRAYPHVSSVLQLQVDAWAAWNTSYHARSLGHFSFCPVLLLKTALYREIQRLSWIDHGAALVPMQERLLWFVQMFPSKLCP